MKLCRVSGLARSVIVAGVSSLVVVGSGMAWESVPDNCRGPCAGEWIKGQQELYRLKYKDLFKSGSAPPSREYDTTRRSTPRYEYESKGERSAKENRAGVELVRSGRPWEASEHFRAADDLDRRLAARINRALSEAWMRGPAGQLYPPRTRTEYTSDDEILAELPYLDSLTLLQDIVPVSACKSPNPNRRTIAGAFYEAVVSDPLIPVNHLEPDAAHINAAIAGYLSPECIGTPGPIANESYYRAAQLYGIAGRMIDAFYCMHRAADGREPRAQIALGNFYYSWNGVAQSYTKACDCWERASGHFGTAANAVGLCYERGEGRPKDLAKARAYFEKAAALRYPAAAENLRRVSAQLGEVPR